MGLLKKFFPDRNDLFLLFFSIPLYICAIGKYGLKIILALLICLVIGTGTEMTAFRMRKKEIGILGTYAWVLFPLVLPPVFPLWMIAISLFFGIIIGVAFFGGHGYALASPVALGWAFANLSFSFTFDFGWSLPFPGLFFGFRHYRAAVLTAEHPLLYIDTRIYRLAHPLRAVFMGNIPQTPGNAVPVVLIACGLLLLLFRAIDFRMCLSFTGTLFLLALSCNYMFPHVSQNILELCIGNGLIAAFFIIPDRRIAPRTKAGRWITGALTGLVAFLNRYFSSFPDGIFFAVLFGNVFSAIIDEGVLKYTYRNIHQ
ncbi:MAG: RnfABCDGE type electron transport complex subunit D [bacterium]